MDITAIGAKELRDSIRIKQLTTIRIKVISSSFVLSIAKITTCKELAACSLLK